MVSFWSVRFLFIAFLFLKSVLLIFKGFGVLLTVAFPRTSEKPWPFPFRFPAEVSHPRCPAEDCGGEGEHGGGREGMATLSGRLRGFSKWSRLLFIFGFWFGFCIVCCFFVKVMVLFLKGKHMRF